MTDTANRQRQTVLLIDDEPANIRVLQSLLDREHEILFATGGEKGLLIADRELPDLILLDVVMPGMNGHEVLRQLKRGERTRDIPVVFVTAMGEMDDEREGLELGAVDYITKPLSPPIVEARVRNHLELKRQRDLLREMTIRDGLTGIYNRRHFDESLDKEWRRGLRSSDYLGLIMIDIDHFKAYNDNYGHSAGDDCLRAVARALEGVPRRAADMVARYGGEEFACLLPGVDPDGKGCATVAEALRAAVEALALPHEHSASAGRVTISLGGAVLRPTAGSTPAELVETADSRLYVAKERGRDRFVLD